MNGYDRGMGIYYCAIDVQRKLEIQAPRDFSIKLPGIFSPTSPFPGMVMMKNAQGYDFVLVNDGGMQDDVYYIEGLKDITEEVYAEYIARFPWAKEMYESDG